MLCPVAASTKAVTESGNGELRRRERVYDTAETAASGGGRGNGGLRLWKVLETRLKPLFGSVSCLIFLF